MFQDLLDAQIDETKDLIRLSFQMGLQRALVVTKLLRDQEQTGSPRWLVFNLACEEIESELIP